MQAYLSNFFGTTQEQVNLESVILYNDVRVSNGGDVPLNQSMADFEYLEIYSAFSSAGSEFGLEPAIITPTALLDTTFGDILLTQRYGDASSRCDVKISPNASTNLKLRVSAGTSSNWTNPGIYKVIGYRRRISTIGLDEILAVVAQPNLFINTWHTGSKVVNQRAFNGDWTALTIGDYGFDMWLKTSTTHKGFIIEAGSYIPGAEYIVQADGVIKGTATAPLDGGHWLHSFPFASDKFDIRLGSVKVPWHPETDDRLAMCFRHFMHKNVTVRTWCPADGAGTYDTVISDKDMRRLPTLTTVSGGAGTGTLSLTPVTNAASGTWLILYRLVGSQSAGVYNVENGIYDLDATSALEDVTDDTEHRLVWS